MSPSQVHPGAVQTWKVSPPSLCQYGTVLVTNGVSLYRTKIFIRFPKTLFDTEDLLQKRKHEIGTHSDCILSHMALEHHLWLFAHSHRHLCQMEDVHSEEEVQTTERGW